MHKINNNLIGKSYMARRTNSDGSSIENKGSQVFNLGQKSYSDDILAPFRGMGIKDLKLNSTGFSEMLKKRCYRDAINQDDPTDEEKRLVEEFDLLVQKKQGIMELLRQATQDATRSYQRKYDAGKIFKKDGSTSPIKKKPSIKEQVALSKARALKDTKDACELLGFKQVNERSKSSKKRAMKKLRYKEVNPQIENCVEEVVIAITKPVPSYGVYLQPQLALNITYTERCVREYGEGHKRLVREPQMAIWIQVPTDKCVVEATPLLSEVETISEELIEEVHLFESVVNGVAIQQNKVKSRLEQVTSKPARVVEIFEVCDEDAIFSDFGAPLFEEVYLLPKMRPYSIFSKYKILILSVFLATLLLQGFYSSHNRMVFENPIQFYNEGLNNLIVSSLWHLLEWEAHGRRRSFLLGNKGAHMYNGNMVQTSEFDLEKLKAELLDFKNRGFCFRWEFETTEKERNNGGWKSGTSISHGWNWLYGQEREDLRNLYRSIWKNDPPSMEYNAHTFDCKYNKVWPTEEYQPLLAVIQTRKDEMLHLIQDRYGSLGMDKKDWILLHSHESPIDQYIPTLRKIMGLETDVTLYSFIEGIIVLLLFCFVGAQDTRPYSVPTATSFDLVSWEFGLIIIVEACVLAFGFWISVIFVYRWLRSKIAANRLKHAENGNMMERKYGEYDSDEQKRINADFNLQFDMESADEKFALSYKQAMKDFYKKEKADEMSLKKKRKYDKKGRRKLRMYAGGDERLLKRNATVARIYFPSNFEKLLEDPDEPTKSITMMSNEEQKRVFLDSQRKFILNRIEIKQAALDKFNEQGVELEGVLDWDLEEERYFQDMQDSGLFAKWCLMDNKGKANYDKILQKAIYERDVKYPNLVRILGDISPGFTERKGKKDKDKKKERRKTSLQEMKLKKTSSSGSFGSKKRASSIIIEQPSIVIRDDVSAKESPPPDNVRTVDTGTPSMGGIISKPESNDIIIHDEDMVELKDVTQDDLEIVEKSSSSSAHEIKISVPITEVSSGSGSGSETIPIFSKYRWKKYIFKPVGLWFEKFKLSIMKLPDQIHAYCIVIRDWVIKAPSDLVMGSKILLSFSEDYINISIRWVRSWKLLNWLESLIIAILWPVYKMFNLIWSLLLPMFKKLHVLYAYVCHYLSLLSNLLTNMGDWLLSKGLVRSILNVFRIIWIIIGLISHFIMLTVKLGGLFLFRFLRKIYLSGKVIWKFLLIWFAGWWYSLILLVLECHKLSVKGVDIIRRIVCQTLLIPTLLLYPSWEREVMKRKLIYDHHGVKRFGYGLLPSTASVVDARQATNDDIMLWEDDIRKAARTYFEMDVDIFLIVEGISEEKFQAITTSVNTEWITINGPKTVNFIRVDSVLGDDLLWDRFSRINGWMDRMTLKSLNFKSLDPRRLLVTIPIGMFLGFGLPLIFIYPLGLLFGGSATVIVWILYWVIGRKLPVSFPIALFIGLVVVSIYTVCCLSVDAYKSITKTVKDNKEVSKYIKQGKGLEEGTWNIAVAATILILIPLIGLKESNYMQKYLRDVGSSVMSIPSWFEQVRSGESSVIGLLEKIRTVIVGIGSSFGRKDVVNKVSTDNIFAEYLKDEVLDNVNVMSNVFTFTGSGKSTKFPLLIRQTLKARGENNNVIYIVVPQIVAARAIYNRLSETKEPDDIIALFAEDHTDFEMMGAAKFVVCTYGHFSHLVNRFTYHHELKRVIVLLDESHVNIDSVQAAKRFFLHYSNKGTSWQKAKVYNLSATPTSMLKDEALASTTNFPVENFLVAKGSLQSYISHLSFTGKTMIICDSVARVREMASLIKGRSMQQYAVIECYSENKESALQQISLTDAKPGWRYCVVGTEILGTSITLDVDEVLDLCLKPVFEWDLDDKRLRISTKPTSYPEMVQRRGRVGRYKPGSYYYVDEDNSVATNYTTCSLYPWLQYWALTGVDKDFNVPAVLDDLIEKAGLQYMLESPDIMSDIANNELIKLSGSKGGTHYSEVAYLLHRNPSGCCACYVDIVKTHARECYAEEQHRFGLISNLDSLEHNYKVVTPLGTVNFKGTYYGTFFDPTCSPEPLPNSVHKNAPPDDIRFELLRIKKEMRYDFQTKENDAQEREARELLDIISQLGFILLFVACIVISYGYNLVVRQASWKITARMRQGKTYEALKILGLGGDLTHSNVLSGAATIFVVLGGASLISKEHRSGPEELFYGVCLASVLAKGVFIIPVLWESPVGILTIEEIRKSAKAVSGSTGLTYLSNATLWLGGTIAIVWALVRTLGLTNANDIKGKKSFTKGKKKYDAQELHYDPENISYHEDLYPRSTQPKVIEAMVTPKEGKVWIDSDTKKPIVIRIGDIHVKGKPDLMQAIAKGRAHRLPDGIVSYAYVGGNEPEFVKFTGVEDGYVEQTFNPMKYSANVHRLYVNDIYQCNCVQYRDLLITNKHCVESIKPGDEISVGGYKVDLWTMLKDRDIAVGVAPENMGIAPEFTYGPPYPGHIAGLLGYDSGMGSLHLTKGMFGMDSHYSIRNGDGCCGGLVIDLTAGQVVGIHSAGNVDSQVGKFEEIYDIIKAYKETRRDTPGAQDFIRRKYLLQGKKYRRQSSNLSDAERIVAEENYILQRANAPLRPRLKNHPYGKYEEYLPIDVFIGSRKRGKNYKTQFQYCNDFKEFMEKWQGYEYKSRSHGLSTMTDDTFYYSTTRYYKPSQMVDPELWKKCADECIPYWVNVVGPTRVKAFEEVLVELELRTSPGEPWTSLLNENNVRCTTKAHVLESYYSVLKDTCDEQWDRMKTERIDRLWKNNLKDERVKHKSNDKGKCRTFVGVPFDVLVNQSRLCHSFNSQIKDARFTTLSAYGINKFTEWESLLDAANKRGFENYKELDGSAWDGSFSLELFNLVKEIRRQCLKKGGASKDDLRRLENMYDNIIHTPMEIADGNIVWKHKGNPSGQCNTAVDNCMAFSFAIYWAYCKENGFVTLKEFEAKMLYKVYGDNSLLKFNGNDFSVDCLRHLLPHGVTITNDSSGPADDFIFLSHKNHIDARFPEKKLPAVGHNRIMATCEWCKESGYDEYSTFHCSPLETLGGAMTNAFVYEDLYLMLRMYELFLKDRYSIIQELPGSSFESIPSHEVLCNLYGVPYYDLHLPSEGPPDLESEMAS